jgi:RNA polymerase sigma-70 factor (ECF subfamily)
MAPEVVPFKRREATLPERSDDELMLLASAGARDAFEMLVRRHAARVLGFCVKSLGDRALAEEIAQEVWLSVWDHRAAYRAEGKFMSWLFTAVRNRTKNAIRHAVRHPAAAAGEEDAVDLSPTELDRLVAAERRARLHRALARVPAAQREAILLRFGEELPYGTVAQILETNESTARARVFHGLRELRRVLRGDA